MQWLFILAGVAWLVISLAGNRKKQQARAEAEKKAAAGQNAPAAPVAQPPRPAQPYSPFYPDVKPQPPVNRPQHDALRPAPTSAMQAAPVAAKQADMKSTLTEIRQTQRHTLVPSGKGKDSHAHEETSMTGFAPDCPPEDAVTAPVPVAPTNGVPSFSWQPNAVLNGIVYAEILGKPKALRG